MSSIGGYLGLECAPGRPLYGSGRALNLGRNALEVILKARGYRRLYAPRFTCDVLREPISRAGVELVLYGIDDFMVPLLDPADIDEGEAMLVTNYFGLKQTTVADLAARTKNLIVDNAQSFYAPVPIGVDSFVTCRKFFGVADGAYLHCAAASDVKLDRDVSYDQYSHLLISADLDTEAGYPHFQAHERDLAGRPVRGMSQLTERVMQSIDHEAVGTIRERNRDHLHAHLKHLNLMPIDPAVAPGPMTYPFLTDNESLRYALREARIYAAQYWPQLLGSVEQGTPEDRFMRLVVHLPVDQRYGIDHMDRIVEVILRSIP